MNRSRVVSSGKGCAFLFVSMIAFGCDTGTGSTDNSEDLSSVDNEELSEGSNTSATIDDDTNDDIDDDIMDDTDDDTDDDTIDDDTNSDDDDNTNNGIDDEVIGDGTAGETCDAAPSLFSASEALTASIDGYGFRVDGEFGESDDFNPYQSSGKLPGCSIVFDALGHDVVYTIALQPGDTLNTRLTLSGTQVGAIYLLSDCDEGTWPDLDGSGMCGSNEYASQGFCSFDCLPLEWSFTWPEYLNFEENTAQTFYLVVDQVGGTDAESFELLWQVTQ